MLYKASEKENECCEYFLTNKNQTHLGWSKGHITHSNQPISFFEILIFGLG